MREFLIPLTPVQSVNLIEYRDTSNVWHTVDPSTWYADTDDSIARINLNYACVWPNVVLPAGGCIRITFTAGFGDDASAVPGDLKQALMYLVGHWYRNREAVVGVASRDSPMELLLAFESVISRYRAPLIY
jgi:uncharacterized phiE125 gp8 family phage protein